MQLGTSGVFNRCVPHAAQIHKDDAHSKIGTIKLQM